MRALARSITGLELPAVEKISEEQAEDPFQILIATLLSARTQDATTHAASTRLFKVARTPRTMAKLPVKQIERLIYPVSFYRYKARYVKACCEMLVSRFGGKVPSTMEELVMLPGVGRKTANLVLILGFKSLQNICVDTHVHRISNRLGWVKTTRLMRRSRRCTGQPRSSGGRTSTSIWSPGDRMSAALSIPAAGIASSGMNAQELESARRKDMMRCFAIVVLSVCGSDRDAGLRRWDGAEPKPRGTRRPSLPDPPRAGHPGRRDRQGHH